MDLTSVSDEDLISGVVVLIGSHRELTAKLVAHLSEIEERRLHLIAGYSSMFDFCQKKLGMSEGEAFRRINAARLGRRFPAIHALLATGAVHLSVLQLVRELLTVENHAELLEAMSWKSKQQVEALLAARFPRPGVPSRIHATPSPEGQGHDDSSAGALELGLGSRAGTGRSQPRSRIEPFSEATFRVEFMASAELRRKLELCRDLMAHANPKRDIAVVVERALDLLFADLESKRLGRTKRPRCGQPARDTKPGRVTNATRRTVFERDGARCTYVSPEGRRCEERAFLELDHIEPSTLGGGDEPTNLRVRCRAHNQLWAEEVLGREAIRRARHFRQQKCVVARAEEGRGRGDARNDARPLNSAWEENLEKVHRALVGMGFRDARARLAVANVRKAHAELEPPTIEEALREAILSATSSAA